MTPLFKIRASAGGLIMTDPRNKSDKDAGRLGETAKSYIKLWERGHGWNREKDISTEAIEKGRICEEDGFDLVSRLKGTMVYKNPLHLSNEWATGTPDPYDKITGRLLPFDIKASYDWTTFPFKTDTLDKIYDWQNLIYAWLAEEEKWTTIYVLVNTPVQIVAKKKERAWWDMGQPDKTSDEYLGKCMKIERTHIYDMELFLKTATDSGNPFELHTPLSEWVYDIPERERILEFDTMFDSEKIENLKTRVTQCRQYLQSPY